MTKASGIPAFWSQSTDGADGSVLTYAVRGGKAQIWLTLLGVLAVAGGAWGAYWLLGGELTVAGLIFILLVPGGLVAFGIHCLDISWFARTQYTFTSDGLVARRHSAWRNKSSEVIRSNITGIAQHYSPPGSNNSSRNPGTWATILSYRDKMNTGRELAFDGMGSPEEARWLGPWVANWAGISLKRTHASAFVEADPQELPKLDD